MVKGFLPYSGQSARLGNVVLATGHGAGGFELSAITGKSIAEFMTSGQLPVLLQSFGLERFQRKET